MNEILGRIKKTVSNEQRLAFISTFLLGIVVHLFMLSNKIPNHDDVGQLYDSMNRYGHGRWFLFFPAQISSDLSLPWLNGVLGILYISISVMLVVWLFQIKTGICIAAVSTIMVTFPTVASTFNYMQSGDSYFFCLLLVCIAVCLTCSSSKLCWAVSVVLLTLSMGIYQSYLPFAAALLIVWHIRELLIEDKDFRKVLLNGIKSLCVIGISVIAYIIITRLILRYHNATLNGHIAGFVINDFSIKNMVKLMINAYIQPLAFYLINISDIHYKYMNYLYIPVIIISIVFSILLCKRYGRKTSRMKNLLLIALYMILPLASGLIYCMCAEVHMLMVYGFIILLLFPIILTDWIESSDIQIAGVKGTLIRYGQIFIVLIMLITGFNYALVSNKAYLSLYLTYEQSYAYANRLVTEIEMQNGYDKGKTIVLIGKPTVNTEYTMPWWEEKDIQSMRGVTKTLIRSYTFPSYLRYYIGVEQEVVSISSPDQLSDLKINTDINTLSCYPDEGSIVCEEDIIFVKFSEVQ